MDGNKAFFAKEQILRRVSLRSLAEEAGAVFRGNASPCPLHGGDNPGAFHLYGRGRKWHCFTRCPAGQNDGDLFTFYMLWRGVDFPTAFHDLSSRAALPDPTDPQFKISNPKSKISNPQSPPPLSLSPLSPIPLSPSPSWISRASAFMTYAHENLLDTHTGAPARAYLRAGRTLQPDTWEVFRLGYNPTSLYDSPTRWGFSGGKKIWLPRGIVIPGLECNRPTYIKIRRPLPGDALSEYLDPPPIPSDPESQISNQKSNQQSKIKNPKFGGPRGGRSILFGADTFAGFPILLLVEGEWDAMLAWQEAGGLCDVASLGGAHSRADTLDLAALVCYPLVLSVSDGDAAGEQARRYLGSLARVETLDPPAHDLSDYALQGGDLRLWIAGHIAAHLTLLINSLDPHRHAGTIDEWQRLLAGALRAATANP